MRRTLCALYNAPERCWKQRAVAPRDQRGRFNLDEAAAELNLDEEYVASLFKPLHYTYNVKGQRYPAEMGRASRPNATGSSRKAMFPLYQRSNRLDKQLRQLNKRTITTR